MSWKRRSSTSAPPRSAGVSPRGRRLMIWFPAPSRITSASTGCIGDILSEGLNIEQPEQLVAYLRDSGRIAREETPEVRVLAGGVSNRTVLVKRASGEAWVLKQ